MAVLHHEYGGIWGGGDTFFFDGETPQFIFLNLTDHTVMRWTVFENMFFIKKNLGFTPLNDR